MVSTLQIKEMQSNPELEETWWKKMWKLKIPTKVKHFVWRIAYSWIPINSSLTYREVQIDPYYSRCSSGVHTSKAMENLRIILHGLLRMNNGLLKMHVDSGIKAGKSEGSASFILRDHEGQRK
uniref:Reverse transcriptase zinc-binding domain-containing protein n=1 Tax=Cannabis sativa TaxID=3483 RepID=A0A803PGW9_CANSA